MGTRVMKASEFIRESEELDEYRVTSRYDPTWLINRGNHPVKKSLKVIQTPLTDYNVSYTINLQINV